MEQEELAVLPSIEWLQAQVPTDQHIFINGWNVSFPHSVRLSASLFLMSSDYRTASISRNFFQFPPVK